MIQSYSRAASSVEGLVGRVSDEFAEALARGERPDIEEYAAQHPQIADVLRRVLPAVEAMCALSASVPLLAGPAVDSGVAGVERSEPPDSEHTLGDFRLLREIGRGGMGIVYEAEQISLGRHVALKVLPFAAVLDDRQLARFKNEARAAATLHHTNIVPVFSVGCEQGVHFYAMQFIEGHTLAQLVDELRGEPPGSPRRSASVGCSVSTADLGRIPTPLDETVERCSQSTLHDDPKPLASSLPPRNSPDFFRAIARLGIQAAEALEHAHQHGVLHRDIKPANLMLDAAGNLWITDFGLARLETDAGMTMTGDLVGTLRYMSPEQASGKPAGVDHRTDVYSLGVTLYEVLTLHPPFASDDRRALLQQIAESEPRSLRRSAKSVPCELETIILKALSKEPAERYGTAGELAGDLRRFLDDKPIVARRPSWIEQARKWTRRHSGSVVFALVSLAVLTLGLAIGMVALFAEQRKTQSALDDKALALATAETNFDLAADAAEQMLERVAHLTSHYRDQQHTRLMLGDVINSYKRLLNKSNSPRLRSRAVGMFIRVADMYQRAEMPDDALRIAREVLPLAQDLCDRYPDDLEYRYALGKSHNAIRAALWAQSKFDDASRHLDEALKTFEGLVAEKPAERRYQKALGTLLSELGFRHVLQERHADAEPLCRRGLALAKAAAGDPAKLSARETAELGHIVGILAIQRRFQDGYAESEALSQEAARLFLRAAELEPRNPFYRERLYTIDYAVADVQILQRKHADAANSARALVERHPRLLKAYYQTVAMLLNCAEMAREDNRSRDDAARYVAWAREAAAQCRRATQRTPEWADRMALVLANCSDESVRDPDLAILFAKEALRGAPNHVPFLNTLGVAYYRRGQFGLAVDVLRQSVARAGNGNERGLLLLSLAYWKTGQREKASQAYRQARQAVEQRKPRTFDNTTYDTIYDDADTKRLLAEAGTLFAAPKPPEP